tara:strand:+ start:9042 stop:9884 length:843 start_codon:yes stop_codon:yes gene_type:complete
MISEQDNTPEEVKSRVTQMTKAIRYKAKKEGGNLFKAFNDFMGSQSGISSTERQAVKQKLGLTEHSSWRIDLELREVADIPSSSPKTDDDMDKEIKEKKVNNKIVINPPMKEAFEALGGSILEVVEIEEQEVDPEKKKQLQMKGQMMKRQQLLDKQRLQAQKSGKIPMGHAEGYAPGDVDQKVGAVTAIPKKDQDDAKARILAKTKAKREKIKEAALEEKVLDKAETDEKEKIVKGMKKNLKGFKSRYGVDAKSVMYATATKMAKKHMDTSKSDRRYGVE